MSVALLAVIVSYKLCKYRSRFVVFQLNILLLQYKEYGSNVKLLICFCVKKVQMVSVDSVHSELGLFMRWESVTDRETDISLHMQYIPLFKTV